MIGKPTTYHRTGFIVVILVTILTIVLAWRATALITPKSVEKRTLNDIVSHARATDRPFIVYRTQKVTDRGISQSSTDDTIVYEFHRYALSGVGTHTRIARMTQSDGNTPAPVMTIVSPHILRMEVSDAVGNTRISWVDVSGAIIDVPEIDTDIIQSGVPSPDGSVIVYADKDNASVGIITLQDGTVQTYPWSGEEGEYLVPMAWNNEGSRVFLQSSKSESQAVVELWVLNIDEGTIQQNTAVHDADTRQYTISADGRTLVGTSYGCDTPSTCGTGPSVLYTLNLEDENAEPEHVLTHPLQAFIDPIVSDNGMHIAYTFSAENTDIRTVQVGKPETDKRLVSGRALAWSSEGEGLIIDRNGSIQIINTGTAQSTTIINRMGTYEDADFLGVEIIGTVRKR